MDRHGDTEDTSDEHGTQQLENTNIQIHINVMMMTLVKRTTN